ncbi:hypothetical protein GGI15_002858 [Coemansia interrupta]|uniref:Uncharacterized protein n=1 Tax=Coemansia interrupta TaxID=1126814 RepID=A0A9W8HFW9_9FUNG|nr:hypothetical protein GGI15_002858 [Coemansia interrupta]
MAKKVRKNSSGEDGIVGPDDMPETSTERVVWTPEDTDNFHWVLSQYTRFEGDKIELNHRYLDNRDIDIAESFENENLAAKKEGKPIKPHSECIALLEKANESNSGKNCRRVYELLIELQAAAGNKHVVRQINTKHINTRSRWSVPFQSLHEVGYLIKNQTLRGSKKEDSHRVFAPIPPRTNVERKNLAAIKALLKYATHKPTFWDEATQSIPPAGSVSKNNSIPGASIVHEDIPEPERWIRAMIKRHNKPMVDFMDKCVLNLANTYVQELKERGKLSANEEPYTEDTPKSTLAVTIGRLVEEVSSLPKPASKKKTVTARKTSPSKKSKTKEEPIPTALTHPSEVFPQEDFTSLSFGNGEENRWLAEYQLSSEDLSIAPGGGNDVLQDTGSTYFSKAENGPKHGYQQVYGGTDEYNYDEEIKRSQIKRTKSLMIPGLPLDQHDQFVNHDQQEHNGLLFSQPVTSAAYTSQNDLAFNPSNSFSGFSSALLTGDNEGLTFKTKHDDEYFSQFINFDSGMGLPAASSATTTAAAIQNPFYSDDGHVFTNPFANSQPITDTMPQTDLLEAIVNLSVNSSTNTSVPPLNYFGEPYMQQPSSPSTDQMPTKMQRVSNDRTHQNLPVRRHSQMSAFDYNLPHKFSSPTNQQPNPFLLGRTFSDEQPMPSSILNWPTDETIVSANDTQNVFGTQQSAFTFQLPYSWSDESTLPESLPRTPGMQSNLPFKTLQTSFSTSNLTQMPLSVDNGYLQNSASSHSMSNPHGRPIAKSSSHRRASMRPAISVPATAVANGEPAKSGNAQNVSTVPLNNSDDGKSKMTTHLVMVNGVPSHIELVHDNGGVHPNPIILPISKVIKEAK